MSTATLTQIHRSLSHIAREIRRDWGIHMSQHAAPYVNAMSTIDTLDDMFYADTAQDVVLRFLVNAQQWRGPVARRVKAELKVMLKDHGYPIR